jgi:hypothetical protein
MGRGAKDIMQRPPRSTNPADVRAAVHRLVVHRLVDELPNSLLESAPSSIEYLCKQGATIETFTFGGIPYETSPDTAGNYRDLDIISEAIVRDISYGKPRKADIQYGHQAVLSLNIRVRVDDWDRFQALREQRDGIHLLALSRKTCNAKLLELSEQYGGPPEPGKVGAYAKFIKMPRSYDPDEVIDWEQGRRW